jgi:hypothetical protein
MASPIWTSPGVDFFPGDLVRIEILNLVHQAAWEEVLQLCRQIRYWCEPTLPGEKPPSRSGDLLTLVQWAGALASRHHRAEGGGKPLQFPTSWRHPLMEEFSRDGYNLISEFEAAVESRSLGAACQIISSADFRDDLGLLPLARDEGLLISFPAAVALAMREHPELQQTMREEFGPIGLLKVRRAMASGDAPTLREAALQFPGTEASAEAHRWLGDRALSGGDFPRAHGHYRSALRNAPAHLQKQIEPRLRLAAALMGQEELKPVEEAVNLNGTWVEAAEFERVVA